MNQRLSFSALLGLARSLLMYYAIPGRAHAWRAFYRRFVDPGNLCFDIGAHVGNRTAAMLAVGAKVVAVEPQPRFAFILNRLYGNNPRFSLVQSALGAKPGEAKMLVSSRTPTVSTVSAEWAEQVSRTPAFASVEWDQRVAVELRTLDMLIAEFGLPAFCKLDIEGYEFEALQGLSRPIPLISFEFLIPVLESAFQSIKRLNALGDYQFNFISGEFPRLALPDWVTADRLREHLLVMPDDGRAGEVYARLGG